MSRFSDAMLALSGLRAYWRLGEGSGTNVNDETANNNDGTYQNTPTLGVAGALDEPNTAVSFNGTDEYVSVPDATALDVGNSFTLLCLVKRGRIDTAANEILIHKGTLAYALYITATSANRIVLHRPGIGDLANSGSFGIADTTAWHFVAAGKDGSTRKVWLDGVDRTSLNSDSTFTDSITELRFANESPTSGLRYQGALDEVGICSGLLSDATILDLYKLFRTKWGASALAGAGGLAAQPLRARAGAATLAAGGALAAQATRSRYASASFSGEAGLTLDALRARYGAAVLTGDGALASLAVRARLAMAALSGTGSLAVAPTEVAAVAPTPPSSLFSASTISQATPGFALASIKR